MKKIVSLIIIFTFLAASSIRAQTPKPVATSAILYKITGKNLKKPSYLFGTIHLICEKDMFSSDKLKGLIDQTGQIMLETDFLDSAALQKAAIASKLLGGKTMKDYLTKEEYVKIDEYFKTYMGISFDYLNSFKPIFATTAVFSSPKILGCKPPVIYDKFLAETAVAKKLPVVGLESMDAQMAAADSVSLEQQIREMKETAADPEKSIADFRKMSAIYLSQNSDQLYNLIESEMKKTGYSQAKLLDNRNISWIPVIEKNIAITPSFIAVGGGHLGGKNGVVNLLRSKGYKLTPIRL
jgi:uncharacterized protein YbaP (TraB family)